MIRLFIGIPLPESHERALAMLAGGIPGARWIPSENIHLTLRFIGAVDPGRMMEIDAILSRIDAPEFEMNIRQVDIFGDRRQPRVLWAGIEPEPLMITLQRSIERALDRLDIPTDPRKFYPHITLAKIKKARYESVGGFLAAHNLLRLPPFVAEEFCLYESHRTASGSAYEIIRRYPLLPSLGLLIQD